MTVRKILSTTPAFFTALVGAQMICAPAFAVSLLPGVTLDSFDYFTSGEVASGDASWYGTSLGTYSDSVNAKKDGFDGFDVITDLYDVDATLNVEVFDGSLGTTTFAYHFDTTDNSGTGINGAFYYSMSGFAGYDIDVGWTYDDFPYVPVISRSGDGDTIRVEYFDPRDTFYSIETLLLRVDAEGFDTSGTGIAGIWIDSFGDQATPLSGLPAPAPVPLPASGLILGGALGLLAIARRKRG